MGRSTLMERRTSRKTLCNPASVVFIEMVAINLFVLGIEHCVLLWLSVVSLVQSSYHNCRCHCHHNYTLYIFGMMLW